MLKKQLQCFVTVHWTSLSLVTHWSLREKKRITKVTREGECRQVMKTLRCETEADRVSSGTLLLRAQLSWSCTDSGVDGPSAGAALGTWLCGARRLPWPLQFRELADVWWWLCVGGRGGRGAVWLWWLDGPERDIETDTQAETVLHYSTSKVLGILLHT